MSQVVNLHENAEIGDSGDDAGELLADLFFEQFEDFDSAQFAFGIVGAALGEADVLAQIDQSHRGTAAPVESGMAARLPPDWLAEINCVQQAVDRQVGVAADGAGEVAIMLAGQGVMPDRSGGILGRGSGSSEPPG